MIKIAGIKNSPWRLMLRSPPSFPRPIARNSAMYTIWKPYKGKMIPLARRARTPMSISALSFSENSDMICLGIMMIKSATVAQNMVAHLSETFVASFNRS
jgi:hypothetical protein